MPSKSDANFRSPLADEISGEAQEEGERRVTPERRHPVVEFVEFDDHIEIGKVVEGIGPKD